MRTWPGVTEELDSRRCKEAHATVTVPKNQIEHPGHTGALRSGGLPAGQMADWRWPARPDGSGVHVLEFPDRWEAHLDRVHPSVDFIEHLATDAPKVHTALKWSGVAWGAWEAWKWLQRKSK